MTLAALLALAASLLPPHADAALARGAAAAADLLLVESDDAHVRSAFVWAALESGWQANPRGDNDGGNACGVLEVHVAEWSSVLPETWTCEAIRADRVLGFRAAILVLDHLEKQCGSLARAWGAYATGTCEGGAQLVARRCLRAGLTTSCEVRP